MNAATERRRRQWWFAALYFCEGAPIGFLWWALPTVLREHGVAVDRIGALSSMLVLPWALKFLWAPILDAGHGRGLRAWIAGAQVAMALTLLPILVLEGGPGSGWLEAALVLHALAAATQDAAIDSLAIRSTPPDQRGSLNGWMQGGMLLGRALFGGGALVARRWIGDVGVVALLSGGLGATALIVARAGRSLAPLARVADGQPVRRHLAAALSRRTTWIGLLFAATSGAGFEAVGALAGPMLVDRGLDAGEIGWFFGIPVVGAMVGGAVVGGYASDRIGTGRVIVISGMGLGAAVGALSLAVGVHAAPPALFTCLAAIYFGIGLFTAATYALFMEITDPALGATQFSAYMGATNVCESWSAYVGGALAATRGYAFAFAVPAVVGLAALSLLAGLRSRFGSRAEGARDTRV